MYPHERSLVEKYRGRPFVIIGVNSDARRELVKDVTAKEKLAWRSFWDGGSTNGPIARRWNVEGWPTLYLIDHNGVVRQKWTGIPGNDPKSDVLDKAIEELLKDAEKAKG